MRAGMYVLAVFAVSLVLLPAGAYAESYWPSGTPDTTDLNAAVTTSSAGFGGATSLAGQYWPDKAPKTMTSNANDENYVRARMATNPQEKESSIVESLATQNWPDTAPSF